MGVSQRAEFSLVGSNPTTLSSHKFHISAEWEYQTEFRVRLQVLYLLFFVNFFFFIAPIFQDK